jgi:hypothetical protein
MAAGNTFSQIASTTLGSAASSVTFSSIAATYTDLVLVMSGTSTSSAPSTLLQFNSDTASNYSYTYLTGNGTAASSGRASTQTSITVSYNGAIASSPNSNIVQIMNYANTTTNKTVLSRANQTQYGTDAIVGLWRSTAAINAITLTLTSSTYAAGSTFNLYGITAA